jgi:hypothetical protein
MHPMLMGALAGAGLAILLYFFEYSSITRAISDRAKRLHVKKVEMDGSEQSRLKNLLWFCLLLPAIGAGLGWLLG